VFYKRADYFAHRSIFCPEACDDRTPARVGIRLTPGEQRAKYTMLANIYICIYDIYIYIYIYIYIIIYVYGDENTCITIGY